MGVGRGCAAEREVNREGCQKVGRGRGGRGSVQPRDRAHGSGGGKEEERKVGERRRNGNEDSEEKKGTWVAKRVGMPETEQ